MIDELDKEILQRINFSERFLKSNMKYVKYEEDVSLFKKSEILSIFEKLQYPFKYVKGGAYVISKVYENYRFDLSFVISQNYPHLYLYVYKNDEIQQRGINNFSYTLNFIEYNKSLLNNNFGLNSLDELRSYIFDMIEIFNDYAKEFISQIKD